MTYEFLPDLFEGDMDAELADLRHQAVFFALKSGVIDPKEASTLYIGQTDPNIVSL